MADSLSLGPSWVSRHLWDDASHHALKVCVLAPFKEVPGCSINTGVETMLELEPRGTNVAAVSLRQVGLGLLRLSLQKGKGDVMCNEVGTVS